MTDARIQKMIDLLKSQVGYHEGRRNGHWNNVNKYAPTMPDLAWSQGQPWCAVFTSWGADKAGLREFYPRTASVPAAVQWAKRRGQFSEYPAVGAWAIIGRQAHVGTVIGYDDTYIYTVEGNTNINGSAEGDGVYAKRRLRHSASIYGYVYPKIPGVVLESADPKYAPASTPAPGMEAKPPAYYVVKSGDTLSGIARSFHVTVAALTAWNRIKNPNLIRVGQRLRVRK